jgi:nitrite reductase (NADH) small subunit
MDEMPRLRIASVSEVEPGQMLPANADGAEIVVCNDGGTLHAFQGLCPHRNGPLAQGNLADGRIICPWHAWEFRCDNGCYDYNDLIQLRRYPVQVEDGDIYVEVP